MSRSFGEYITILTCFQCLIWNSKELGEKQEEVEDPRGHRPNGQYAVDHGQVRYVEIRQGFLLILILLVYNQGTPN